VQLPMPLSRTALSIALITLAASLVPIPTFGQIAPGVTQSAAHTANVTGTVKDTEGRPVPGAGVSLVATVTLTTKADEHGIFIFRSVPWGTYQLLVSSPLGTVSQNNLTLNGDVNVAIQYQPKQLTTIAHVTTGGAGAHINVTSSSITSVSPSDYAFQGNSSWIPLLASIPGIAPSGVTIGGINPTSSVAGGPQVPVILSVNGALPYQTSTTLDGMPLQGTSFSGSPGGGFDLGSLPLNAFDTADVVRGPGANAPSIVDSIGGSFVLHGPGAVDRNHYELSISNDPYGGVVSNVKTAVRFGKLSATIAYGTNDSPGPLGNVSEMAAWNTPTFINGLPVQGSIANYVEGAIPNTAKQINTLLYCCVNTTTAWYSHGGVASLLYQVTPHVTTQVLFAGAASSQNDMYGYWPVEFAPSAATPPYSGNLPPTASSGLSYPLLLSTSNYYPSKQSASLLEQKITASIGRGVLRLAALQLNSYYGQNGFVSPPSGQYTIWGTADIGANAPGVPTAFNGTRAQLSFPQQSQDFYGRTHNRDLLASYAFQLSPNSSAGLSYVTSFYNNPSDFNFYSEGAQLFSFIQKSDLSETTRETRLHFDTDVSAKFSVGLSWYITNATFHVPIPTKPNQMTDAQFSYSAPRLGAVWQANRDLAIRAAVGGGFALPQLYQLLGFSRTCAPTYCNETTANLHLQPEKSFGFDVGLDARIHRNTVLSLDLYRTNLYGQLFTTQSQSTYNGLPLYIVQYGNIATSRMEGINLDVRRDVPRGYYWRGTLGLTRGYVVNVPPGFYNDASVPCTSCLNQTVVPGINFNSATYAATVPYADAYAQIGYRWTPDTFLDVSAKYYGNNNIYLTLNPFTVVDLHTGYGLSKNFSLLAEYRNITGANGQSIQNYNYSYGVPTIKHATGFWSGGVWPIPYGPRSVVVTGNFKW
jgi:outer membrane receptor protein involved in Fe transport